MGILSGIVFYKVYTSGVPLEISIGRWIDIGTFKINWVLRADSPLLARPNRIDRSDWTGWVQERSTYMPTTADSAYTRVLGMNDPGEPENANALLTAKIGKGTYVFTTLALFRQLPAGVPGAARLFVNILNAGAAPTPARRQPVP